MKRELGQETNLRNMRMPLKYSVSIIFGDLRVDEMAILK
jgi:hypothetical protein